MDTAVFEWLQALHTTVTDNFFVNITDLGNPSNMVIVALAFVGYLCYCRKWSEALLAGAAITLCLWEVEGLKYLIGRERPVAIYPLIPRPNSPSMPSGHSAMSMIVFLTMAWTATAGRRLLFVYALSLSFLIGLSRMYLGVHWCTDVLVGWSLGLTSFGILIAVNAARSRYQHVLSFSERDRCTPTDEASEAASSSEAGRVSGSSFWLPRAAEQTSSPSSDP